MNTATRSPLKVFLVDGSTLLRQRIAALIEPAGNVSVVGVADDVGSAIEGIERSEADAAILDLRLTDSYGLDLVTALAQQHRRVLTIVLTNYSAPAFRDASFAAGADFFFDKTSEFDLARDTIARIARARAASFID